MKMKMKKITFVTTTLMGLALLVSTVNAAEITFTTGTADYPDTEVSTDGTLIGALNLGTTTPAVTTVNTVDFDGTLAATIAGGVSLNGGVIVTWSGANADWAYSGSGLDTHSVADEASPTPIVFSGLTIDTEYEIQLMFGDFRNLGGVSISVDIFDQADGSGTPEIDGLTVNNVAQIVTGTFTADATTQNVYVGLQNPGTAPGTISGPVNALQIRSAAASTPGTLIYGK